MRRRRIGHRTSKMKLGLPFPGDEKKGLDDKQMSVTSAGRTGKFVLTPE